MGFWQALLKPFKRKSPVIEQYLTHMPKFESTDEILEFMERKHLQQEAQLKSELAKARSDLAKIGTDKKQEDEEKKIKEIVYKKKQEAEAVKSFKSINLVINGLTDYPTFFFKNNVPFKKLAGFRLEETKDGEIMWYPLLKEKIGLQKEYSIINKPSPNFESIFKEDLGIVSQMRGGKIDTNYDVNEDGQPVLLSLSHRGNPASVKLADIERREYELKLDGMKNQMNELYYEVKELNKEMVDKDKKIADQEIELEKSERTRRIYGATIQAKSEKDIEVITSLANSHVAIQNIKLGEILTRKQNRMLQEAYERLTRKYGERLYKEDAEIIEQKQKGFIEDVVAAQRKMEAPAVPASTKAKQAKGEAAGVSMENVFD